LDSIGEARHQAKANLFRPFALLRLISFRPEGVLIRAKKPQVALRLLFFG
jgi:hypothetical protein